MNKSVSVLNSIEILPLDSADINPFLTKVRIKVFHLGDNRNLSHIDKDTAIKMAKTLRGNPIVARYREETQDFTDHGEEIIMNDQGIQRKVLTKPYGFVDLNADVWFEDYDDTDENGQIITHTYLVTEGMIWTELYKELQNTILDGGRPQSMELHEGTLHGYWSKTLNPKNEIFIINDAVITKLCALGENTEPCFLGASITPEFELSKEDGFVKELINLKKKFQFALQKEGGNLSVDKDSKETLKAVENFSASEDNTDEVNVSENKNITEEFTKKEEDSEKESKEESGSEESKKDKLSEEEDLEEGPKNKEKQPEVKHSLHSDEEFEELSKRFDELNVKYFSLEEENKKLIAFKQKIEDKQKDDMIASFYMLSDEDKRDVLENKVNYTLDEIKAKLSIICVDKKVDFNLDRTSEKKNIEQPVITFNLDSHDTDSLPAWLKAVESCKERM